MSSVINIKRGDTGQPLRITVNGIANLDAVTALAFKMASSPGGDAVTLAGTASVEDSAARILRYDWAIGDTNIAEGHYIAEFEMTMGAAGLTTVPTVGFIHLHVGPRIP